MPSQLTPIPAQVPYDLEVARGNVTGVFGVTTSGRNTDVDAAIEDIWSGASAIPQIIWLPPTQARIHAIVSTSTSDDGSPAGVGAHTVRVSGLVDWDTAETSEDITLDGTNAVNTSSSYVIIKRMEIITKGATDINVGTITATAATDGTISAQIEPSRGQTEMAIYGVPSVQNFYMTRYYVSMGLGSGAAQTVDATLRVNHNPDVELLNYIVELTLGLVEDGDSHDEHRFEPELRLPGPTIIKVQAVASGTNNDIDAGFDGYLITE